MTTRKELGEKLTEKFANLAENVYKKHKDDSSRAYAGEVMMDFARDSISKFRKELREIKTLAEEYLVLAPEMRSQFENDVSGVNSAINEYEQAVEKSYRSYCANREERDRHSQDRLSFRNKPLVVGPSNSQDRVTIIGGSMGLVVTGGWNVENYRRALAEHRYMNGLKKKGLL